MPFIDEISRENLDERGLLPVLPGERCYVYYRNMVRAWREMPKWTTAHNLRKEMTDNLHYLGSDDRTAYTLAWDVFFALHVMPYEMVMREKNGDVE